MSVSRYHDIASRNGFILSVGLRGLVVAIIFRSVGSNYAYLLPMAEAKVMPRVIAIAVVAR